MTRRTAGGARGRRAGLVIAHLFPDLLNLYGDRGNVETLARRAGWRGLTTEVRRIGPGEEAQLRGADIIFVGGGADQQQRLVADAMASLVAPLRAALDDGAALLAVCAGFQNLGHRYRSAVVGELEGPGILDAETTVPTGARRLVGGAVVALPADSPIGAHAGRRGPADDPVPHLVGFENHAGRTTLGPTMRPLGRLAVGRGNDPDLADEGAIALPGEGGVAGLRIGTYLHGPLLPRNPHLADFVIACGLARGLGTPLEPLPDDAEWLAHDTFEADWTAIQPGVHPTSRVGRSAQAVKALIGF